MKQPYSNRLNLAFLSVLWGFLLSGCALQLPEPPWLESADEVQRNYRITEHYNAPPITCLLTDQQGIECEHDFFNELNQPHLSEFVIKLANELWSNETELVDFGVSYADSSREQITEFSIELKEDVFKGMTDIEMGNEAYRWVRKVAISPLVRNHPHASAIQSGVVKTVLIPEDEKSEVLKTTKTWRFSVQEIRLDFAEENPFIEIDSSYAEGYVQRAIDYLQSREFTIARQVLDQGLELDPDSANGLMILGVLDLNEGQLEDALIHLNQSIAADPGIALAYANRGLVYFLSDSYELAIQDLSLLLKHQEDSMSYGLRGLSYAALAEYALAKSDIEHALAQPYLLAPELIAELEATLEQVNNELASASSMEG